MLGCDSDERTLLEFGSNSPFAKLFVSWLAHSWKPEHELEEEIDGSLLGLAPTEVFLQRITGLDPLLYRYLETCAYSPLSFYEVLQCEAWNVSCRDVLVGREYEAFGDTAAECLKAGDIFMPVLWRSTESAYSK